MLRRAVQNPQAAAGAGGTGSRSGASAAAGGDTPTAPPRSGGFGFGAADRMLEAVATQRDRFRGELSVRKNLSEQLTAEVAELRRDNLHLYKKVRWLEAGAAGGGDVETGGGDGGGGGMAAAARRGGKRSREDGGGGGGGGPNNVAVQDKYARLYERSLHPSFVEWERREAEAAQGRLWCPERALLAAARRLLARPAPRLVLLAYLLLLHLGALGWTWGWGYRSATVGEVGGLVVA